VTRERIVHAAARIVLSRGVVETSIEEVLTASNVSRSQLHRYFANKEALIEAVVDFQVNPVLARQQSLLARVDSVSGLREWADVFVAMNRTRGGVGLCPIGGLVGQLAGQSSAARAKLEDAFRTWESYLAAALRRMQERGELDAAADLAELGTGVMAALQGGLVLAHTGRSEQPVRTALGLAVDRVALAAAPAGHVELKSGKVS
jgi:AcrR family transcriptional regulator